LAAIETDGLWEPPPPPSSFCPIEITRVSVSVEHPLFAVILTLKVPLTVGIPLIVLPLRLRPAGIPVAV
jgi:hypothetical protein